MAATNKMFGAMAWSGIERISIQAIQFVLGIILARILSPTEYGIMAILFVFIILSEVFVDSGFTSALIQKKDRDLADESTVFLFNIGISIAFYLLLWVLAPYISGFYEIEELTIYIRVFSVSLIINSLFTVPRTLLTIKLDFKLLTKINLIAVIVSGTIAICLAYTGFGVWSLIWQVIIRSILTGCLIWIFVKWKPILVFSKSSFHQLFSYGSKLLVSSLLVQFFSQLNSLLIGKYINAKSLGFYSRGIQFSDFVFNIFNSSINGVLLPALAPIQDQKELLKEQISITSKTAALITVPIFLLLTLLAEPIILVLLTDKWALAIPIMQIFSIARLITIASIININVLYIIGRTDLVLKQQYVCIGIRIILVIGALKYGIVAIAWAELISSAIHFFINAYYPGKLINYSAVKQIKDLYKIYLAGIIMCSPIIILTKAIENKILLIALSLVLCIPLYYLILRLFKIQEVNSLQRHLIGFLKPKKNE